MDRYVTGAMIKKLREDKKMTQSEFAEKLMVSDKTVSKWENGKGYPDILMLEPIAKTLGISVAELMSGTSIVNKNRSSNILRSKIYVCPVCGNMITSIGDAAVTCHGILLPPLEAETPDNLHKADISIVEDDYYIRIRHPMTKSHYISFIMGVSDDRAETVKLYPEGNAETRLKISRTDFICFYCSKDGLYKQNIR